MEWLVIAQRQKTLANVFSNSYTNLLSVLKKICSVKLTNKQKNILEQLQIKEQKSTQLVKKLAENLKCSQSALWNNLRELVNYGLISYKKGKCCRLSKIGLLIIGENVL